MFGWFSAATARASRSKRSENFSFETLIATMRSSRVSRAFHTSPIPPAPIRASTSYGPRREPGMTDDILRVSLSQDAQPKHSIRRIERGLLILTEEPRFQIGLRDVPQRLPENCMKCSWRKVLVKRNGQCLFFTTGEHAPELCMASADFQHLETKTGECPQHFSCSQLPQPCHVASG